MHPSPEKTSRTSIAVTFGQLNGNVSTRLCVDDPTAETVLSATDGTAPVDTAALLQVSSGSDSALRTSSIIIDSPRAASRAFRRKTSLPDKTIADSLFTS